MYGWRGKIGLLIPANNTVIEPELNRLAPEGVTVHSTRMIVEGPFEAEALHRMEKQTSRGIEELLISEVDVIAYACMSTSLVKGSAWDREYAERLSEKPVSLLTAANCTIQALQHLGVGKVAVLSPYPAAIHPLVNPYFADHGLTVTTHKSLDIGSYQAVTKVTPETVYTEARAMRIDGAEAICILATDLRTLEAVPILEQDLGIPVVSTNIAICWMALNSMGVRGGDIAHRCRLLN